MIALTSAFGEIEITTDVITNIVGGAAAGCEGIVGMASKNQLRDGFDELLKKENFSRGVITRLDETGRLFVDMYIIVGYGESISNVAIELQNRVNDVLLDTIGMSAAEINVYVQGVRLVADETGSQI